MWKNIRLHLWGLILVHAHSTRLQTLAAYIYWNILPSEYSHQMRKQALDFLQFLTEKLYFHGFGYAYTIHCVLCSLFSISEWVPALVLCVVAPNLRISA